MPEQKVLWLWVCGPQCTFWPTDDKWAARRGQADPQSFMASRDCEKHPDDSDFGPLYGHVGDPCYASLEEWEGEHQRLGAAIAARRKVEVVPDA